MEDRIDRLERQVDQQGRWADEKLELIRGALDEVKAATTRTAVILESLGRELMQWREESRTHGDRLREVEGTLNGRHGEEGLVAQVKALSRRDVERFAENRAHARARGFVAAIWGAISGAAVAAGALWTILTAKGH